MQLQAEALLRTASRDLIVYLRSTVFLKTPENFWGVPAGAFPSGGICCSARSIRNGLNLIERSWSPVPFRPGTFWRCCGVRIPAGPLWRLPLLRRPRFLRVVVVDQACCCSITPDPIEYGGGKRLLKRLFLGKLIRFPVVIDEGMAAYSHPVVISPEQPVGYKIFFAVCQLA